MTTIFGHGRLRLYLLKLLDESPRHGYEIISLLRDRFPGIYSPSPGTIYPRLARLEEEGLVTHEEVNGRKVYRLTDKGRAELRERERDLEDLERQITESVRDIAQAVQRDVRDTISHLREELKAAAQHTRRSRSERQESAKTGADDVWSRAADEQEERRDREREHGFAWNREWEKFAHTFGWVWPKGPKDRAAGSGFERILHDFTHRVRDIIRETGGISEAAIADLRRILDETLDIIRRDAARWGPPPTDSASRATDNADKEQTPRSTE